MNNFYEKKLITMQAFILLTGSGALKNAYISMTAHPMMQLKKTNHYKKVEIRCSNLRFGVYFFNSYLKSIDDPKCAVVYV